MLATSLGNICHWISTWLTERSQQVVLDGASSDPVIVQSGIPQGTVLGPLMFLLYINDIADGLSSPLRLFADDCLLYRTINSEEDAIQLQNDLDQLSTWANKWQLRFNVIIVLPKMEYAATVWDPYYQNDIQHLEKVQRRAARWVLNDFSRYSSVTDMLQQLSWPTLQVRRRICRLQTLFKIINNECPLSIPSYYLEMERTTRHYHPRRYIQGPVYFAFFSTYFSFQQFFYFSPIMLHILFKIYKFCSALIFVN